MQGDFYHQFIDNAVDSCMPLPAWVPVKGAGPHTVTPCSSSEEAVLHTEVSVEGVAPHIVAPPPVAVRGVGGSLHTVAPCSTPVSSWVAAGSKAGMKQCDWCGGTGRGEVAMQYSHRESECKRVEGEEGVWL